ncbi:CD1375 family protein [Paenibacillus thermotolerans]|nr:MULTISPECIES: CD1375 family protein [unclassified Paenibacillus]
MNMIPIYVSLIKAGRRTVESVPEQVRAEVQALLDKESQASSEEGS